MIKQSLPKGLRDQIDELVEKHTVALTKTHPEHTPQGIVSFDTRVVNTYEFQQDLLTLFSQYIQDNMPEKKVITAFFRRHNQYPEVTDKEAAIQNFEDIGYNRCISDTVEKLIGGLS